MKMNKFVYFLFRRRTAFLAGLQAAIILFASPDPRTFWMGVPLVVAGQTIRLWASGYLTKLRKLVVAGPFAMCRNPLYVGSFLISLGYLTISGRIEIWIAGIALFWLFHGGAIAYEERLLRRIHKQDFVTYCRSTPRLVPKLVWPRISVFGALWPSVLRARATETPKVAAQATFRWSQVFANAEHRTAVGTILFTALLGLMAYYPHLAPSRSLLR